MALSPAVVALLNQAQGGAMRRYGMYEGEYSGSGLVGGGLVGGALNKYPYPLPAERKKQEKKGGEHWLKLKTDLEKQGVKPSGQEGKKNIWNPDIPKNLRKEYNLASRMVKYYNTPKETRQANRRAKTGKVHEQMTAWYNTETARMRQTHPKSRGPSILEQRIMRLKISDSLKK